MMRPVFACTTVIACSLACGCNPGPKPVYQVFDVGTLRGLPSSKATGINEAGDVVGRAFALAGAGHAFLWHRGHLTPLPEPLHGGSVAHAINSSGQIAGQVYLYSGGVVPVQWQKGREVPQSPGPLDVNSPVSINDAGDMAGWVREGYQGAAPRAVAWWHNRVEMLPCAGKDGSLATDIDPAGRIVGWVSVPGSKAHHACVWSSGSLRLLETPRGTLGSEANGINRRGDVAGQLQLSATVTHACLWSGSTVTDLGTLGGACSCALGINSTGDVVGWAEGEDHQRRAFLFRNGRMTDLNKLVDSGAGWILRDATSINDHAQIVGCGRHGDRFPGFVLSPVASGPMVEA